MTEEEKELVRELRKLNQQLAEFQSRGRLMIYSAHPLKFAFYNFLAGIAHTLGSLFGYFIIGAVVFYLLRGVDWSSLISRWLEQSLRQIHWEQLLPQSSLPPQRPRGVLGR